MPRRAKTIEEKIAFDVKRAELTWAELKTEIDKSRGDVRLELKTKWNRKASLRLSLRCKRPGLPEACTMAVVLGGEALSKIDWHQYSFTATDGTKKIGWHKHVWSVEKRSCEHQREHLPGFNPQTVEEFIVQGFLILNIVVREGRDATSGQLPLA